MVYFDLIHQSLQYIETHLDQSITLDGTAQTFNVSKYFFNRVFNAVLGENFNQYIRKRKMNLAITLMKSGEMTLTEVAYALDFPDQSSFIKAFKKVYEVTPTAALQNMEQYTVTDIPEIIERPFKNYNGDIVSDFTLLDFESRTIRGIVFEVDLADDEFKNLIRSKAELLINELNLSENTRSYMVYSNCRPGSTKFNAIYGIEAEFETSIENVYSTQLPSLFTAKFNYSGDLLEIGDLLETDFYRFLRVSKLESAENHIELIQVFNNFKSIEGNFEVYVPIKKFLEDENL